MDPFSLACNFPLLLLLRSTSFRSCSRQATVAEELSPIPIPIPIPPTKSSTSHGHNLLDTGTLMHMRPLPTTHQTLRLFSAGHARTLLCRLVTAHCRLNECVVPQSQKCTATPRSQQTMAPRFQLLQRQTLALWWANVPWTGHDLIGSRRAIRCTSCSAPLDRSSRPRKCKECSSTQISPSPPK